MSSWVYIGAAYGLTWAMFVVYGVYLHRRLSRARAAFTQIRQSQGDLS